MRVASIVNFEEQERLAELLKYLRGRRSQREFGQTLGVSHPTISGWENCHWEPSEKYLERIAQLCGKSLAELKAYLRSDEDVNNFAPPPPSPPVPSQNLDVNLQGNYSLPQIARILRVLADMLDPPNE